MPRGAVYAAAAVAAAALSFVAGAGRPHDNGNAAALDGAALFRAKGCATCHDGPAVVSMTDTGPSLADAPSWASERVGGLAADEYLEQSMRNPSALISPAAVSGVSMPVLRLSDGEIDSLVAYLLGR